MWDIILIVVAILSLAFIVFTIVKKFNQLANLKIDNLPEMVSRKQKDVILRQRLERRSKEVFQTVKTSFRPVTERMALKFRLYYEKLKDAERDLRRRGYEKLSTSVSKSNLFAERLVTAKQLINQGEFKKAEEVVLDVISMDQQNVEAYKLLANIYRETKEFTQAKETLEYLLKLEGDKDPEIFYNLANLARERGDLKTAEEEYLQSISLAKDNHAYFLSLAEVYLDLEDKQKALDSAQKALVLSPNNPKILDFLIRISIIMQEKGLAKQYLDKLKEVNPENNNILDFSEAITNL